MVYNSILTEIQGSSLIITINRPKALNALNREVMHEMTDLFDRIEDGKFDIKGIVITGSGEKAFIAGADITEFMGLTQKEGSDISRFGHELFNRMEAFHLPIIAAIQGYVLGGGCELAMACHIRIAGEKAKFGQPEANLGLIPGYGATQRLCQLVGKAKAIEWLMTCEIIDAQTAVQAGLANKVVPTGTEIEEALNMLKTISSKGPKAIKNIVKCVNAFYNSSINGFALEIDLFGEMLADDESKEGVTAFLEKRSANF